MPSKATTKQAFGRSFTTGIDEAKLTAHVADKVRAMDRNNEFNQAIAFNAYSKTLGSDKPFTSDKESEALKPLNIAYSIYGFTNTVHEEEPIVWLFNGGFDKTFYFFFICYTTTNTNTNTIGIFGIVWYAVGCGRIPSLTSVVLITLSDVLVFLQISFE